MIRSIAIAVFLTLCFCAKLSAQTNLNFEKGLIGWQVKGAASITSGNTHEGTKCVQLKHGQVFQHIKVAQLTVISFNAFVKASDSIIKPRAFVRFFDVKHRLLLSFDSAPVKSLSYESTGNYTETPALTSYMEIGVKNDSHGLVYVDDFKVEINAGEPKVRHASQINHRKYMKSFWKSDTIYNETVLLLSENGKSAHGKLLYEPDKILSVKKFDGTVSYKTGIDYELNTNVITRMPGSSMPFTVDTSFDTKKDLAWYNLQSQWVVVTYTHADKWDGPVPVYKGDKIPRVLAKLKRKKA